MSTAHVYLTPGLPVEIQNADRLVYLPDGSQHVLDVNDRPLFTAPPKTGVCIVMEYDAQEPTEAQVARFAREDHAVKMESERRQRVAADETQQFRQIDPNAPIEMVNVNSQTGHVAPVTPIVPVKVAPLQQRVPQSPFPPVGQFGPASPMTPGTTEVRQRADVPADVTGEMVVPDFQEAPTGVIPQDGSLSPLSPDRGETSRMSGPGREAG